jgi:hypothetical protein
VIATLTFNLENIEEREEHYLAINASKMRQAIVEVNSRLRELRKYRELKLNQAELLEEITKKFHDECGEFLD